MRVRVSDPHLVSDLLDFLRGADCEAIHLGQNMVAVALAQSLPYETARMELDFQLGEWRARHSDVHAHVVDQSRKPRPGHVVPGVEPALPLPATR